MDCKFYALHYIHNSLTVIIQGTLDDAGVGDSDFISTGPYKIKVLIYT